MKGSDWRFGFVIAAIVPGAIAGLLGPTTALAGPLRTWYVSQLTGTDIDCAIAGAGTSGNPFRTIGWAIGCANDRDTVSIDGADATHFIYFESNLVISKKLTLIGTGAYQPAIDAGGNAQVLENQSGDTTIINIELDNGKASTGGGILNVRGAKLTLSGVTVYGNSAKFGGGIYNQGGLDATDVTIRNNTATGDFTAGDCTLGAGFHAEGGGIYNDGTPPGSTVLTLTRATIDHNQATSIGCGEGGGIYNDGGSVTLTDSDVNQNNATGGSDLKSLAGAGGGGIANFDGKVTVDGSTVRNNSVTCNREACGAGAGISNLDLLSVKNTTVSSNGPGGFVLTLWGGGIYTSNGSTVNLYGPVTIRDNVANQGGGIYNYGLGPPVGQVNFKQGVTTFSGNSLDQCGGTGTYKYGPGTSSPSSCPF